MNQGKFPPYSNTFVSGNYNMPSMTTLQTQQQPARARQQPGQFNHNPYVGPGIPTNQVPPAVQINNRPMATPRMPMAPNSAQGASQSSQFAVCYSTNHPGQVVMQPAGNVFPSGDNSYGGYDSESMGPALRTDMHHKHKGQFYPSYEIPSARHFGMTYAPVSHQYYPQPPQPFLVRPASNQLLLQSGLMNTPGPVAPIPHIPPPHQRSELKSDASKRVPIIDPKTQKDVVQNMMDEKEKSDKKKDNERKKICANFQLEIAKAAGVKQPPQLNNVGSVEVSVPLEEVVCEDEMDHRHAEDAHQAHTSVEDKSDEYAEEKQIEYQRQMEIERLEKERIQEQQRQEREKAELEHQLEHERIERENIEHERKELERKELERKELERKELERKELERKELEIKELEIKELERKERERLERERLERERLERERLERERLEHERKELERMALQRIKRDRIEQEQLDRERVKQEREQARHAELMRKEEERLEARRLSEEKALREKELLEREEEAKRSQNVQITVIEPLTAVPSPENVDLSMPPPSSIPVLEASTSKKKKKQQRDQRQKGEYTQQTPPARQSPVPMQPKPMSPPPAPAEPEEKQELEQKEEEKEADRKVMEKNAENLKSLEAQYLQDAEDDDDDVIDVEQFRTSSGKMAYSRDYMLKLRDAKLAMTKPPDLPVLACVLNSPQPHNSQSPMISQSRGGVSYRDNMPDPLLPVFMDAQLRTSNRHGMYNRGGGPKMNYQQVIKLSINKPVELNKSENAWVPEHKRDANDNDDVHVLYKKARGILNKLTPQNFDSLVHQFNVLPINSQKKLEGVIDLVFDKAVEEPNYCRFYAHLCQMLQKLIVPLDAIANDTDPNTVNFRKLLLTKCQREYETDKMKALDRQSWQKKIDEETEQKKKEELNSEMEEAEQKIRRRYLGNVRFIGELYKAGLLSGKVMHECIQKMLTEFDEDKLECLCKLMVTIGANLEKDKDENKMEHYFLRIKDIEENREKHKISSRLRFMLQDLRDMRGNNWKPRREVAGPKKIAQVHEDMEKEALKDQYIMLATPTHGGKNDKQDRRGDMNSGRKGGYNQAPDEWNQVQSKRGKAPPQYGIEKIDPNKLPGSKSISNDIKLGPGVMSWGKGSQGGKLNQDARASNANMFSALSSQSVSDNPQQRSAWGRGSNSRSGSQTKENPKLDNRRYNSTKQPYTQERRRLEDSRQSLAARDGRGSAASSRESSTSREVKSLLKGKPTLDDEGARHYAELYTDEYIGSQDKADMLSSVADKFSDATIHKFVTNCVHHVLEKSPKDRNLGGAILEVLMSNCYLAPKQLQEGFEKVLEIAEDLIIDIPKLFEYIGEIIEPLLNSANANKSSKISLTFLRDAGKSCIQSGHGSRMLAGVLKVLSDKSGTKRAAELWSTSGCKLSEFLGKDQDEKNFIGDNKFEFLFGETPQNHGLSDSILAILRLNKEHSEIEKLLDKAKDTSSPKDVVRAFTTAILQFCCGPPSKALNEDRFQALNPLLLRVIGQQSELEMECLLSVQQVMSGMACPRGLTLRIFELLYDKNTVTEDTFFEWRNSSKEAMGKSEMAAATEQFFNWLTQAEEESSGKESNEER